MAGQSPGRSSRGRGEEMNPPVFSGLRQSPRGFSPASLMVCRANPFFPPQSVERKSFTFPTFSLTLMEVRAETGRYASNSDAANSFS